MAAFCRGSREVSRSQQAHPGWVKGLGEEILAFVIQILVLLLHQGICRFSSSLERSTVPSGSSLHSFRSVRALREGILTDSGKGKSISSGGGICNIFFSRIKLCAKDWSLAGL